MTLEPGGQFELSGATLETLHATCAEVNSHLYQAGRGGAGRQSGVDLGGGHQTGLCCVYGCARACGGGGVRWEAQGPNTPPSGPAQVRSISEEMGIGFLGAGFDPKWRFEDIPRMPKVRAGRPGWLTAGVVQVGRWCFVTDVASVRARVRLCECVC